MQSRGARSKLTDADRETVLYHCNRYHERLLCCSGSIGWTLTLRASLSHPRYLPTAKAERLIPNYDKCHPSICNNLFALCIEKNSECRSPLNIAFLMIRSRPYKSRKQNREISGSLQGLPRKGTPTDTRLSILLSHTQRKGILFLPRIF